MLPGLQECQDSVLEDEPTLPIFLQSLARLGGHVTGVDASQEASKVATLHAQSDPGISDSVRYRVGTAEQLADEGMYLPMTLPLLAYIITSPDMNLHRRDY